MKRFFKDMFGGARDRAMSQATRDWVEARQQETAERIEAFKADIIATCAQHRMSVVGNGERGIDVYFASSPANAATVAEAAFMCIHPNDRYPVQGYTEDECPF